MQWPWIYRIWFISICAHWFELTKVLNLTKVKILMPTPGLKWQNKTRKNKENWFGRNGPTAEMVFVFVRVFIWYEGASLKVFFESQTT